MVCEENNPCRPGSATWHITPVTERLRNHSHRSRCIFVAVLRVPPASEFLGPRRWPAHVVAGFLRNTAPPVRLITRILHNLRIAHGAYTIRAPTVTVLLCTPDMYIWWPIAVQYDVFTSDTYTGTHVEFLVYTDNL